MYIVLCTLYVQNVCTLYVYIVFCLTEWCAPTVCPIVVEHVHLLSVTITIVEKLSLIQLLWFQFSGESKVTDHSPAMFL